MGNVKAAIITIGDELLIGQTIDTNSGWIAQRLNDFGIDVVHRVAVGDYKEDIVQALNEELNRAEIVLVTGGLGPTADDITKPLLCEYFGGKMVMNEEVLTHVTGFFQRRKLPMLERNNKQAEVPDNCKVLFNKQGTAPGMLFEKEGRVIIAMPGVPHEMMGIMEDEVIPELQRRFASDAIEHRSIMTAGQGESFIAERIKDIESTLPSYIRLAYLPGAWMVKLRLTGRANDKQRLIKELDRYQGEIANVLEDIVVALEDIPLEQIIGKTLSVREQTIGLAESCTGGYIAHKITQVMGSGKYFNGSIVCYQDEVKEKLLSVDKAVLESDGAVSEEVAKQMAHGARNALHTDYGFGITGLLSPGGDDDRVEVGTVWISVTDGKQEKTKKFLFTYDRLRNKEVAVSMGLLLIWQFIHGKA